ncbi:hypothetical protein ACJX0J_014797 [Zea mays]
MSLFPISLLRILYYELQEATSHIDICYYECLEYSREKMTAILCILQLYYLLITASYNSNDVFSWKKKHILGQFGFIIAYWHPDMVLNLIFTLCHKDFVFLYYCALTTTRVAIK